jgi:galacturan 1,4-alpha-galacturonidase
MSRIGQYPNNPDYDENICFEDVTVINSFSAAYIKTWQGVDTAESGNGDGGGGGSGLIRNSALCLPSSEREIA